MATMRCFQLLFSLALLSLACGCGSGSSGMMPPPPPAKPEFLYALTLSGGPNSPTFQLSSLKVDASTAALSTPVTTSFGSQLVPGIAVDPASKFLYLSFPNPGADSIGIFSIDPNTGVPTQTGVFLLTVICALCPPPSDPGDIALAPNGKDLYYGSATFGQIIAQGIGALSVSNGTLNMVPGSPFPADQVPFRLGLEPTGKYIYTENLDPSGVAGITIQSFYGFSVDPGTGALTPVPDSPIPVPASATATAFEFHPSGTFLYSGTGMSANGVLGWSIDSATGNLTVLGGSPFQIGVEAYGGAMTPSGKFLYLTAGPAGGIDGFSVDSTSGALTLLPGSPFVPGSVFGSPAIEPGGKFLFAQDANSAITAFSIDGASGALTAVGVPVPVTGHAISLIVVRAP